MDKKEQLFSLTPHMPGGMTTPAQLKKIAEVAENHNAQALKVTAAQKISILGLNKESLAKAREALAIKEEKFIANSVKSIQVCRGREYCRFGMQNALEMGLALDKLYYGMELPARLSIGVSGCGNSCAESWVKDIGLLGKKNGYQIVIGGNAGKKPRIAKTLFRSKPTEEVLKTIADLIFLYKNAAQENERFAKFIDRATLSQIKHYLLADPKEQCEIRTKL